MQAVLSAWDWTEPVSAERLDSGLINRSFWVRGQSGQLRAVLQELNTSIFRPVVHHDIAAITEALAASGMLTPRIVNTRAGDLWHTDPDGGVWRRMTVVGERTVDRVEDLQDAVSAGALIAKFHAVVKDLDYAFQMVRPDVHDTQRHMNGLTVALAKHSDHRLFSQVRQVADQLFAAWGAWQGPTNLPERIVHGDLKISNVRFVGHDAVALIDLDTFARRTFDVELGDAMRSWCNPAAEDGPNPTFHLPTFTAAMEGYAQGCPPGEGPTADEWASIVPATERISLELSARFAKDALEERYFGWKEQFGTRGDHNLARARNQARLAASLGEQRAAAEAAVAKAMRTA